MVGASVGLSICAKVSVEGRVVVAEGGKVGIIIVGVRDGSEATPFVVVGRRTVLLGDGVVGKELGSVDGKKDGYSTEGMDEGIIDGAVEGCTEGEIEGNLDGLPEGGTEGNLGGAPEGLVDGICDVVGEMDGACDGYSEGAAESQALIHIDLSIPVRSTGQAKSGSKSVGH
jgi:hypothetical protein